MSNRVFVHGVPDTPLIWSALLDALGESALTPCLPGFCSDRPQGFQSTKDEYAAWLVRQLEQHYADHGPIDLFGHDWGALLTLRAASLRPDLIKSWAISSAAIDPEYRGHLVARIWNTPFLGELAMAISPKYVMDVMLRQSGLPRDLARQEAAAWRPHMRQSILALYRSANGLRFDGDWIDRLKMLPQKGMLIWGARDPYVPQSVATRFAQHHDARLHIIPNAGHWVIVEQAREIASMLRAHWQS